MIEIVKIKNPFDRTRRETERVSFVPGQVLTDYVPDEGVDFVLNGNFVEQPGCTFPCDGDQIIVMPHVGDGMKRILSTIASMFLMQYVGAQIFGNAPGKQPWFANAAGKATLATYLAAGAVMAVGGRIINAIFPTQLPIAGTDTGKSSSPTYGWDTPSPITGEGGIVGITYGECIPAPQVLESHVETVNGKQYLNILLCGGIGPVDYIKDIKIGNTLLTSFSDYQLETRLGLNDQLPISFFYDTPLDQGVGLELTEDSITQTSDSTGAVSLEVTVEFPGGLYHIKDDGNLENATVVIRLEYRLNGTFTWTHWQDWSITAAQNTAVRRSLRVSNLAAGKYDVRATIISRQTTSRYCTTCSWSLLTAYNPGRYSRPNKVLVGLRILATNQLSGGVPQITWRQGRMGVHVWNPDTGQYEIKSARNPIWAAYDIYHQCRQLRNINTGAYEYVVFGVPHERLDAHYDEWVEAAAYADEMVLNQDGENEKRFEFDAFYDSEMRRYDAAQLAASVGHAAIIPRGNNIGIKCDKPGSMVQIFGEGRTIMSSLQGTFAATKDRALAVEVVYNDENRDYKITQFLVRSPKWNTSPNVQDNPARLQLFGVRRRSQAYREGVYTLANNDLVTQFIDISTDIDAMVCQYGDIVGLNHSVPQLGIASGRIVGATENTVTLDKTVVLSPALDYQIIVQLATDQLVTRNIVAVAEETETDILTVTLPFDPVPQQFDNYVFGEVDKACKPFRLVGVERDGDLRCKLNLAEYVEGVYTGDLNYPIVDYTPPGSGTVEVSGLNLAVETKQDKLVINASWYLARGQSARSFMVYFRAAGEDDWQFWETTENMTATITDVSAPLTYEVKVCTHNGLVQSPGVIETIELVAAGGAPPEAVDYFSVSMGAGDVVFSWAKTGGLPATAIGYEIRRGATAVWDIGQIVVRAAGKDTSEAKAPAIAGTWIYMIKPYNNAGYAETALSDSITITTMPQKTYVLTTADYQAGADLDGDGGSFVGGRLVNHSVRTWADIKDLTYAELKALPSLYNGVAGAATFTGGTIDIGKVAQVKIIPVEKWLLASDRPVIYEYQAATAAGQFTDWRALPVGGTVTARWLNVRGTIEGGSVPGVLESIDIQVVAELSVLHFPNTVVAVGGTTLTFDPPFLNKPAIAVSPNGATALRYRKTAEARDSVSVVLEDTSGTDVGGLADVTAIGF